MASTSKRLEFLIKHTSSGKADPFAWYGLAMEYRSLERPDDALLVFTDLRSRAPEYVPAYLMCAQMLVAMSRIEDARDWLSAGVAAARSKGDAHALSELESLLGTL